MIEREAQQRAERPLVAAVIYNRLKQGIPLGIDATTRYETGNWQRAAHEEPAGARLPLQHAHQRRPAARADRQPRAGLAAGRGPPGARRLPLLRGEARHLRRARLLVDGGAVRARPPALQRGPRRGRRQLSDEMLGGNRRLTLVTLGDGEALLGMLLVAVWPPVEHSRSPAMHNAAFRELGLDDWRYEAIDVEPERFEELVRALPARGFARRQRHDPAQAAGARGRRHRNSRGAGGGRRQHPRLRGRRGARRQHRRGGRSSPRCASARPRRPADCGHWCWAPAGRGGPWSTRCCEAGAARVEVWNRHPERARGAGERPLGTRAHNRTRRDGDPVRRGNRSAGERHLGRDDESRLRPRPGLEIRTPSRSYRYWPMN